jgi:hypothetical protein
MKKITFLLLLAIIVKAQMWAQDVTERPVQPGVPFLTIAPDARGSAMGDIGVATSPDVSSIFYNAAKYSFIDKKAGIAASYSPWLRGIASDMSINYISGFYKINSRQVFATSLKYFAIGEIQFTNEFGQPITATKPNEFALSAAYSMMFTDNFSGAISMKFIYSNLTGGVSTGLQTHAGVAVAGDLGFYYNKNLTIKNHDSKFTWGIALQNLGTKINYGSNIRPFIPSNLKTGIGFSYKLDEFNSFSFSTEMNKLMVPTPDSAGSYYDLSVTEGIIRSFYDAPGGFKEELHEVIFSGGLEYNYNNLFFLRGGIFYENPNKGGRRFFSTGLGFKYSVFSIDFSYLVPLYTNSPLANTMRFSLSFYFDKNK